MRKAKTRDDEERFGSSLTGGCYKCGNPVDEIEPRIYYCETCGTVETEEYIIVPEYALRAMKFKSGPIAKALLPKGWRIE